MRSRSSDFSFAERYQREMKKSIICLFSVLVPTALVTLTPIGPLLVYGWLVPIIDPIFPRPAEVPHRAQAEYLWKGFGLVWNWDDQVTDGCASWTAAEGAGGAVRILSVYDGSDGCGGLARSMYRFSIVDETVFGSGRIEHGIDACPFKLTDDQINRYLSQVRELQSVSEGALQDRMLEAMLEELKQIDGESLATRQFGCAAPRK